MALSAKAGSFNITTGASDVAVNVGFTPKVLIFWYSGRTESTDAAGGASFRRGIGLVQSVANQGCVYGAGDDAGGSMVTCRGHRTGACLVEANPATNAITGRASLKSFDADTGFTLQIDDAFAADLRVSYLALGGADVTDVFFGTVALATGIGTQDVTAPGFQPDVVLIASSPSITAAPDDPTDNESSILGLGFARSATARFGMYGGNDDGSAAADALGYAISTECVISGADSSPGTEAPRADFNGMLSTGFQLDVVEGGIAIQCYYLAIKGPQVAVGTLSGSTSLNGTTTVSGLAFQPKALVLASDGKVEGTANTATAHDVWSVGFGTSTTERTVQATHDENATVAQECATAIEHDEIVAILGAADAIDALYDVDAMLSDGFRIICDDAPTSVAPFIGYIAFGDAAVSNQTVTPTPAVAKFLVPTPSLAKGAVTLTPTAAKATFTVPTPAVANVITVTPTPAQARYVVPTPTLIAGVRTATPTPALARFQVPSPTLLAGPVTLTPGAALARFVVTTPVLQRGTVTLTPTPTQARWLVPTPTVTNQQSGVITPTPAVARFAVPTPSLLAGGVTLTSGAVTARFVVPSPTLRMTVTPSPAVARFVLPPPGLLAGGVSLTLGTAVARWLVPTPEVGLFTPPTPLALAVLDRSGARYAPGDLSWPRFQLTDASAVRLEVD